MSTQDADTVRGEPTVEGADFLTELRRASSALSRANQLAGEPWRSMSGALLDAVTALEELVEDDSSVAFCPVCKHWDADQWRILAPCPVCGGDGGSSALLSADPPETSRGFGGIPASGPGDDQRTQFA